MNKARIGSSSGNVETRRNPEVSPQTGPGIWTVFPWSILVVQPVRHPQPGSYKPTGTADVGARLRATRLTAPACRTQGTGFCRQGSI